MRLSFFAAGLLLVPSAHAFWRLPCAIPVVNSRIDPIISPGKASSHAHTIMGSNAIGYNTQFGDLRSSQCTTCMVRDDKSAYWIPELYYQNGNGFQAVDHGGMVVYYLQRNAANETVEAFPDGLRMFTGNPYARSFAGTPESKAISWNCINFNGPGQPDTSGFGNTNCPNGLRAQVFFPACWDGVNLDSPDHKSHMAYPDGVDSGQCPYTHPHHLVSIFFEVWFNVAPFNNLNDGGRFVLANGDPTGYGLHGDFLNGWDRSVLSRAVQTCTDGSGVIENCPVFQNEGRFVSNADMNSCAASNPLQENVSGPMPNLPGCIAVTNGPGPASPTDLVPGCTAAASRRSSDEDLAARAPEAVPEMNRRSHRAMRGQDWLLSV
ncbi:putative WSC domain protein [Lactarius vividus]|nr:putative WSC domain protein [Lactarius vividus]